MNARFVRREWENSAHTILSVYFEPAGLYRYLAGQYADVTVPHDNPDSRGISRIMTLSSSPNESLLKITMRIFGQDGRDGSTYKRTIMKLQPGDLLSIQEAMGDLVLPLDTTIPLLFVAGGVGIASYAGVMKWLVETNESREISMLYSVSRPDDIVLQNDFDEYATSHPLTKSLYTPVVNSAYAFIGNIDNRRLTADIVYAQIQPNSLIYLSGPEMMVDSLFQELLAMGISHQQIIFDYFTGYTDL